VKVDSLVIYEPGEGPFFVQDGGKLRGFDVDECGVAVTSIDGRLSPYIKMDGKVKVYIGVPFRYELSEEAWERNSK
jgi:hypothetical protein